MFSTRFTELVGCEVPIQLAPMGGQISTPELVAAVTSAGAHGMFGLTGLPVPALEHLFDRANELGAGPYGGNYLVPFIDREAVEFTAAHVPLVDFYLGPPDSELVDLVHGAGALAGWQVTSRAEAEAAEAAGCDLVIAHGIEAGGRNPGGIGLLPLLAQVIDAVQIPVVAAGGISTGRGVAAALAMGADAARLGTRFLAATEAGAHSEYVSALLEAGAEDTVRTDAFHLEFPEHLAGSRVLRSAVDAASAAGDVVGEMNRGDEVIELPRFVPLPPSKNVTGEIGAMALYAGESVWAVREVQPAAEIVAELMSGAEAALRDVAVLLGDSPAPEAGVAP